MTVEEQRIWSAVSWPSSLPDVLQRIIKMAKAKTFLTVQAFRATPSMLPQTFSPPRIDTIDLGTPLRTPDDIPEEQLVTSTPKLVVDENIKHIISALNKDKGKKPTRKVIKPTPPDLKQSPNPDGHKKKSIML